MMVFGDTSGFFALLVRDDAMHERAKTIFAGLARHQAEIVTSSFVLVETISLLQRRVGLDAVKDFNERI